MSARTGNARLRRRCWLCEQQQPVLGGKVITARRHWVCRPCWDTKVYQLADWLLDALPPSQRLTLLAFLGPRRETPIAQA